MVSNEFYIKKDIFKKKTKSHTQYETIINNYNSKMHSFPVLPSPCNHTSHIIKRIPNTSFFHHTIQLNLVKKNHPA